MNKLIINTDGASKGNPGDAGIGVLITAEDGSVVREIGEYIGQATNNVAEYSAFIRGLQEAASLNADSIEVRADSELLVKQINGLYKVKNEGLKPLFDQAVALLRAFRQYKVIHVYRDKNSRADELANMGIKGKNLETEAETDISAESASHSDFAQGILDF